MPRGGSLDGDKTAHDSSFPVGPRNNSAGVPREVANVKPNPAAEHSGEAEDRAIATRLQLRKFPYGSSFLGVRNFAERGNRRRSGMRSDSARARGDDRRDSDSMNGAVAAARTLHTALHGRAFEPHRVRPVSTSRHYSNGPQGRPGKTSCSAVERCRNAA